MVGFSRRGFIKASAVLGAAGSFMPFKSLFSGFSDAKGAGRRSGPVVISTWKHGLPANEAAWKILSAGGSALDAVEAGVRVPEGDPEVTSVGYGGYPDEDCHVTLDACIMGADGNCGSVAFVEGYKHPISIARKVMEETDHELIVGAGAEEFARKHGFAREDILTEKARQGWLKWKSGLSDNDDWIPPTEDHDTIGMVALDAAGRLSGACTTSGLAFKIHGRVGDSPIIGSGMYVDNKIGAAAATGRGEAVIKVCGSFLVVEYMRQGLSPGKACIRALERIVENQGGKTDFQVGFIALDSSGEYGAASLEDGFEYAVATEKGNELYKAEYIG
ncbi:MAG: N(4)-(beta-N-acetylglucosaminyl)-L-asparaginase [Candidatus Krumholzibacteriota bacterium]|nr:N(4)-(beta-N-acetylglucosaminyl)-L-asparaginase [Candidatus Krumholzibacteriota bacterium]